MYYEERLIDGIMCWRGDPNSEFRPMTLEEISYRYDRLSKENVAYINYVRGIAKSLELAVFFGSRKIDSSGIDLAKIDKDGEGC